VAVEPGTIADAVVAGVPRLTEGVELIGEYQESGFQEPRYILRRADGQVIQLPRLLYLLASSLDGRQDVQQAAALLSVEFGRVVSARQVSYLIEHRLQPTGITAADPGAVAAGGTASMKMTSDPLLALKFRVGVVPERAVWHIAGLFRPMFWPQRTLEPRSGTSVAVGQQQVDLVPGEVDPWRTRR
jgi:putative peptide zinc metalloprotease protein